MKNLFNTVIGIEVHTVINSKTKMFSSSKSDHNCKPNDNIFPIDLGHPGTMPQPNKTCIQKGITLAYALNMDISKTISFDRKNYFYQDLPKGFQITQQYNPIGRNGVIQIDDNVSIEIERIHLEEDTAKQFIDDNNNVLLDYNRAGMPLIEIVTKPCIKSAKQACDFLKELKRILIFNNISDAKLEDGSMRADVNISVNHVLSDEYGTRVEIKNINSISNVEKAIEYEVNRQINLILSNKNVQQETRKFNDKTMQTEFMRLKTDAVDYHYMTEPNTYIRDISSDFINESINIYYTNINDIKNELLLSNISNEFINILLDDVNLYNAFNYLDGIVNNKQEVIKWLCIELVGILAKNNSSIKNVSVEKLDNIGNMINLLLANKINGKQAKEIIKFIYETNKSVEQIIEENNFKQITDKNIIRDILQKYIDNNPNMVEQYKQRPERGEKFFIGMVMKDTNGQANPDIVNEVLKNILG